MDEYSQKGNQERPDAPDSEDDTADAGKEERPDRRKENGMGDAPVPHLILAVMIPKLGDDINIGDLACADACKEQNISFFLAHVFFFNTLI